MKRLLVLGGISVLNDVVAHAREMGYYVIVTDYLENSPAKKYADEAWMLSIDDVDGIVKKCRELHVDGVMNYCIDPGQKPYQQICEKLNLPCVAGFEQFNIMTNKDIFKKTCRQYSVGVIPEYFLGIKDSGEYDVYEVRFPVVIKPVDSRASKGFRVCYDQTELAEGIRYALSFSKRKKVLAEKYMRGCPEICAKYVICDGSIFLTSMADVYDCVAPDGTRVYLGTQTYPSKYYDEYIATTDEKVRGMLKGIGVRNGAVSFTGFYDNGTFRFFDPSLRMGGAQDWVIAKEASGVDISELLTNFAMTGSMGDVQDIRKIDRAIAKKHSALLYFDVRPGIIARYEGIEEAKKVKGVVGFHICHSIGDEVKSYGTAENVAIRFVLSCDTSEELINSIDEIQKIVKIKDSNGIDMIVSPFDAKVLKQRTFNR